jgi:hypothetical protein
VEQCTRRDVSQRSIDCLLLRSDSTYVRLLNLETAHQANRGYVFEPYTWDVSLQLMHESLSSANPPHVAHPLAVEGPDTRGRVA